MRDLLIEQLAYLREEVALLKPLIDHLPDDLLEAHTVQGSLSLKELYGHIVEMMERYAIPALRDADPGIDAPTEQGVTWNEVDIGAILGRIDQARGEVVALLEAADDVSWDDDGLALTVAVRLAEDDLETQRVIAERLSERPIGSE